MKILLVNPPNCGRSIPEERYGIEAIKMIFRGEPLSLEVLAGNLHGHEVEILDLKADPEAIAENRLPFRPDLVGLTGVACEANTVLELARTFKERYGCVTVVGGQHASSDPAYFLGPRVDYVVVGLGKLSLRELVDALAAGRTPAIPGVVSSATGMAAFTPRRYTSADLVEERPPRYDLVARHRDLYVMSGVGGKVGFVASAFGCTHQCDFCCIPNMTGGRTDGRYLVHGTETVLNDMTALGDLPLIRLVDANTFGRVDAAMELGRRLRDTGWRKKIVADVRADTVVRHPDLFALWQSVGLAVAVIGFEAIDDHRLAAMHKQSRHDIHLEASRILKDLGIRIVGDFIVSPDYDREDFERLRAFVDSSAIDLPIPSVLTPLPGTPLHRKLKDRITITDLDYYTFTNAVVPTRLPEKEFYRVYAEMLEGFLAHLH
ncbi:MAG: cobalamin-dependent protein [Desulfosarcinaceae bacterium]